MDSRDMSIDAAKFTPEQIKKRAYLRIAHVLYEHWEEGTGPHSRLFDILLNHFVKINKNEFIVGDSVAYSAAGSGGPEHVVPCAFIIGKCLEKFEQKKSEQEVAEYIEANLKIVRVTQDERKRLDSLPGLKAGMPDTWKDGDDIMVRLHEAKILFKLLPITNG